MESELIDANLADPEALKIGPEQPWHNKVPWKKQFRNVREAMILHENVTLVLMLCRQRPTYRAMLLKV